jgi:hypothetical protein
MPPKRRRTQVDNETESELPESADVHLCIRVSDQTESDVETVLITPCVAREFPYLATLLATPIGSRSEIDDIELSLPAGCTARATTALLTFAEAKHALGWQAKWEQPSIDEAVALVMTADFLQIVELIPSLVKLCRAGIKSQADADVFTEIPVVHTAVQALTKELCGDLLTREMSFSDVKSTFTAGIKDGLECQIDVVIAWMKLGERTEADWVELCNLLQGREATYDVSVIWKYTDPDYTQFFLRPNALYMAAQLAQVACSKPQYFEVIVSGLLQCINETMPSFRTGYGRNAQTASTRYSSQDLSSLISTILLPLAPLHEAPASQLVFFLQALQKKKQALTVDVLNLSVMGVFEHPDSAVTSLAVDVLLACGEWQKALSVPTLKALPTAMQAKLIAHLMPTLQWASVATDVREYVVGAIKSGQFTKK